jgi:hypothetical protein
MTLPGTQAWSLGAGAKPQVVRARQRAEAQMVNEFGLAAAPCEASYSTLESFSMRSAAAPGLSDSKGQIGRFLGDHTVRGTAHACDHGLGLLSWRSANDNRRDAIGLGPSDATSEVPRKFGLEGGWNR